MPGRFICPEQMKRTGSPRCPHRGAINHEVAGRNLFNIHVREKKATIRQ